MSKVKDLAFSGTIGNIIFYKIGEKSYVRMKPSKVRQTQATKDRSNNFGIAARAAKALRQQLDDFTAFQGDKDLQNGFTGAIAKWLKRDDINTIQPSFILEGITNYQFNKKTAVDTRYKVPFGVSINNNIIEISIDGFIPTQSISVIADTISVECKIAAASCRLNGGTANGEYLTKIIYPYTNDPVPAQTIQLPIDPLPGNLIIIALSLTCNISARSGIKKSTNPAFMPAGIVSAIYC